MYICMYEYMHVCRSVYVFVCIYLDLCMYVYMCVCMYGRMHVGYTCMYVCRLGMYAQVYVACLYVYV
jgi:hypothetical protein